jgi:Tol biopolymer transport system component
VIPLTTYPGLQYWPSFSPDGSQVAFVWNGARQDNFDIYVTMVRGGPPRRLTTDPAPDYGPSWSPDGGQIAFLRGGFVYLISPLGPPERKLTHAISVSWEPDGKSLVISDREPGQVALSLYRVSPATTERQKITTPPEDSFGDSVGRLSPNGKNLAFVRLFPGSGSDIYIEPLAQGLPRGTAWRLTNDSLVIREFAWTADGRAIVFSSDRGSRRRAGTPCG